MIAFQNRVSIEIVVCTFNGARFITEQLESIFKQTHQVDLISIYDDCSTDATLEILSNAMNSAKILGIELNVCQNKLNLGYSKNFSAAILNARCDIIFLCDQDDIWEKDKVAQQLAFLIEQKADLAFSDGTLIDSKGNLLTKTTVLASYGLNLSKACRFKNFAWQFLLKENYVNGAALAGHRAAMQAALPVPSEFPHDYWLVLWVACFATVACTPQLLYRYRQHSNNVIGVSTTMKLHHQLMSIWRNPTPPRQTEISRLRAFLARLPADNIHRADAEQKLRWLLDAVEEPNRVKRLATIMWSLVNGKYRRFSAAQAFVRDLVAVIRSPIA